MKKTITFREGDVYFSVGFYDSNFELPMIDTYVYCGIENDEYLFIDATGHVAELSKKASHENAHYLTMKKDSKSTMLDKESLIEWLKAEHTPTKPAPVEYVYRDA